MLYRYESPLGRIVVELSGDAVCGLWFEGQRYFSLSSDDVAAARSLEAAVGSPGAQSARDWLDAYFAGKWCEPPRLEPRGSAFQTRVWRELRHIRVGEIRTYGELATAVGCRSAQAVGGAVGRNPISLMIPCHRVLGSDGKLTGYAGGIRRKKWLLQHEGIHSFC